MPLGQRKTSTNHRRRVRTDRILFSDSATMRPCQSYISKNIACNVNPNISEKYTECVRHSRVCELASNIDKFDHALRE